MASSRQVSVEAGVTWTGEVARVLLEMATREEDPRRNAPNFSAYRYSDQDFLDCAPAELFPNWSQGVWKGALDRLSRNQKLTPDHQTRIMHAANEHGKAVYPILSAWSSPLKKREMATHPKSSGTTVTLARARLGNLPPEFKHDGEDVFLAVARTISMWPTKILEEACFVPLMLSKHALLRFIERRGGSGGRMMAASLLPAALLAPSISFVSPTDDAEFIIPSGDAAGGAFMGRSMPVGSEWLPVAPGVGLMDGHDTGRDGGSVDYGWMRFATRSGHGFLQIPSSCAYRDIAGAAYLDIRSYLDAGMLQRSGLTERVAAAKELIGFRRKELERAFTYLFHGTYLTHSYNDVCKQEVAGLVPKFPPAILRPEELGALRELSEACRMPASTPRSSRLTMHAIGMGLIPKRSEAETTKWGLR